MSTVQASDAHPTKQVTRKVRYVMGGLNPMEDSFTVEVPVGAIDADVTVLFYKTVRDEYMKRNSIKRSTDSGELTYLS